MAWQKPLMKVFIVTLLVLFAVLQSSLWFGSAGYFTQQGLQQAVADSSARVAALEAQNKALTVEVLALKADSNALEALARSELGLAKKDEVFYLIPAQPARQSKGANPGRPR